MALPDISLAQFNRIASGSYNAGQIDIQVGKDGKAELVKINNHVWSKSKECPWGLTPWTLVLAKGTGNDAGKRMTAASSSCGPRADPT